MLYNADTSGVCPHCSRTVVFLSQGRAEQLNDADGNFHLITTKCPGCNKSIVSRIANNQPPPGQKLVFNQINLLWPARRPPRRAPAEVPKHIADDYAEASLVLDLSPKASAALSRRCLQAVLREAGGAMQKDLVKQIEAVLPALPSYIAPNVDAIRNIGNFAAHPSKDQASGEIVSVEVGEAEWNLDVLGELFDFYYVQPALAQAKRDALNAKLVAAGKLPMK